MARVTHTDHAKCTVWTPQVKAELSGPRAACAIELFRSVDLEKMPKVLAKMQEIYEAHKARAAEREAKNAKPRCPVGGMIQPGAMCGSVIVGGKFCGSDEDCPHKQS